MVSSRLDYCNSVLYGTSRSNVDKLQRVQNSLARIVKVRKKFDHITPVLSELHWLSIDARIRYKIAVLTFKALTTNKPTYLAELISIHRPVRELRSSSHNRLHVRIVRTVFGSCAFCHAAPAVWNGLPPALTDCLTSLPSFKRRLKTLFCSQLFRRWSRYWSASAIRRYFHNFVDIGRVTNCVLLLLAVSFRGLRPCPLHSQGQCLIWICQKRQKTSEKWWNMSRLKRQNVVSFWRQSLQTSKNSVPGSNQKWKETNVNLREMLCLKYTQA